MFPICQMVLLNFHDIQVAVDDFLLVLMKELLKRPENKIQLNLKTYCNRIEH